MVKIYVSPSSQTENTYAAGNTNEAVQCRKIARALKAALERCGFEAMVGGEGTTMYTRVAQSNAWGADLHIPIHTNAFDGALQGTRLFCWDLMGAGYEASRAILAALAPVVPGESDGIRTGKYYEITRTKAPCAYVEAAFHDHEAQALWITENTEVIAEAICQGVCRFFDKSYVPSQQRYLYRVQAGVFRQRENAALLAEQLKKAGFSAIVSEVKEEKDAEK